MRLSELKLLLIHLLFPCHYNFFKILSKRKQKKKTQSFLHQVQIQNARISCMNWVREEWKKGGKVLQSKTYSYTQKVVFILIIINKMRVRFSFHNKIVQTCIFEKSKRHWREIEGCLSLSLHRIIITIIMVVQIYEMIEGGKRDGLEWECEFASLNVESWWLRKRMLVDGWDSRKERCGQIFLSVTYLQVKMFHVNTEKCRTKEVCITIN